uniref:Transmembrane 9 superfamily member n=1 Tax=Lotharella globosa TaxID=91324 RepID=A0A6U3B0H5_9EUKA
MPDLSVVLLTLLAAAEAFYLPGVAPRDYLYGETVELKVNKLDSVHTQLPYDFYSLPFCTPDKIEESAENLGEVLSGDRIENSMYKISMKIIESCKILCRKFYKQGELKQFADKIKEEYRINWIVDNLPAATKFYTQEITADGEMEYSTHYEKGFALGFMGGEAIPGTLPDVAYVHNHVRLNLYYHEDSNSFKGFRIVAFEVEPYSVKHEIDGEWKGDHTKLLTCTPLHKVAAGMVPQAVSGLTGEDEEVIWTYDVQWAPSSVKWASRWDLYLKMTDSQIHWFSIINSTAIVLFLSAMLAMIMMRTLHRDFRRYNEIEDDEEAKREETGWKLVHAEVFRAPEFPTLLCVMVGTGYQLLGMAVTTLVFAVLGFLSPANRGALMLALLLLFVFMGIFAGYGGTRLYRFFGLTEWVQFTFWTAITFPGICFTIFFILNMFVWGEKSTGAVPYGTLIALLVLWFGISVPLVYLGSYFAFKRDPPKPVKKPGLIPRHIPEQAWYLSSFLSIFVGGILPFGACFIEIFFIMSSVWLHQFYYMFGFLFIVFIILFITCAEITIVMCYFQLCHEDYHWWWRAFLTAGSSALYLFLYSIMYFCTKMEIVKPVSTMLFFGYMFLISLGFFLMTGTIGFVSTFYFVETIYGSIKTE